MTATTKTITEIKIVHTPHGSCSYRGSNIWVEDDAMEITRAAIEKAKVLLEIEQMKNVAGGGDIGGGQSEIVLVVGSGDDSDEIALDSPEARELIAALPAGRIEKTTVAELSAPVWDGSDHTSPDVEAIAALAGCRGAFGHMEAGDYLADDTSECQAADDVEAAAEQLVEEASKEGVHLALKDVRTYLMSRLPEQPDGEDA